MKIKKNLVLIGIIISTIVLAVLSVITALKIKQLGTQPVAPSVPKTKPKAVESEIPEIPPGNEACKQTFVVALAFTPTPGPSPTPTATGTPGPSPTPTATGTPGPSPTPTSTLPPGLTPTPTLTPGPSPTPTSTLTPGPTVTRAPTSTPKPRVTEVAQATPTEVQLPAAGLKIPTLSGLIMGFLLIAVGAALVF